MALSRQNGPTNPDTADGTPFPPILTPRWIVSGTQVDEEVPGPARNFQKVLHAPQIHPQKAGPAPDGDHAPRCHPHILVVLGQFHYLPVQVVGTLREKGYSVDGAGHHSYCLPLPHVRTEGRERVAGLQLLTSHATLCLTMLDLNLPCSWYLANNNLGYLSTTFRVSALFSQSLWVFPVHSTLSTCI
jgi:hypothetical protein